ncbi:MAG: hypothetical protein IPL62_17845 [Caulobacteraceae bacterium]|nr:hypothetical protein [Caulobacteraceae bacterium]
MTLATFADALSQSAESLTKYDVWQGRDGEGASLCCAKPTNSALNSASSTGMQRRACCCA